MPTPRPIPRPSFRSSFEPSLFFEEFWSAAAPDMGLLVDDAVELEVVEEVVLAADVVACESDDDVGVEEDVDVELLAEASCRT